MEPHHVAACATGVTHSACVTLDGMIFLWGFGPSLLVCYTSLRRNATLGYHFHIAIAIATLPLPHFHYHICQLDL